MNKKRDNEHPSTDYMFKIFNDVIEVVDKIMKDEKLTKEERYNTSFHAVNTLSSFAWAAAIKRMYNPDSAERWQEAVDTFSGNTVALLPQYLENAAKMMAHFEFQK